MNRNNNEAQIDNNMNQNNNKSDTLLLSVPGCTKSNVRVDYQHHMRNVWSGAITTNWYKHVKVDLAKDLKDIDLRLRVEIDMLSVVRSLCENLSQTNNYAKGSGYSFCSHMEEYHPNKLLCHLENTNGNR